MSTPEIPLSREYDKLLTAIFFQAGICGKELTTLNCCCIYLQVTTLADISDGSGCYMADAMVAGQPNTTFTSGFTWPNQGQPTKQEWAQWHHGLQLAIAVDHGGQYQQPLGKWLLPWDKDPHHWHWLVMEHPLRLYHWDQEWQVHMPVGTQAMWWLKFQKQHTRATQTPPAMALRVTCMHECNHISLSG